MAEAYWVAVYHEINDAEKFAAYIELASPAIAKGGGEFIARGVAAKAYEKGKLERTTIIAFPSLDAAVATHDGADYQAALAALGDGVTRDLRFVVGLG